MLKLFGGGQGRTIPWPIARRRSASSTSCRRRTLKALEELAHWHESVSAAEASSPTSASSACSRSTRRRSRALRKLAREYLAARAAAGSRFQENLLWTRAARVLAPGRPRLRALHRQLPEGAKGADEDAPAAAVSRALRASRSRSSGSTLRYGPVDPAVWGVLNRSTRSPSCAARRGARQLTPAARITPQEFLKAAMFSASSPDSLLPLEVELAERLIAELAPASRSPRSPTRELLVLDRPRAGRRRRRARCARRSPRRACATSARARAGGARSADRAHDRDHARGARRAQASARTTIPTRCSSVLRHLALYWAPRAARAQAPAPQREVAPDRGARLRRRARGARRRRGGSLDFDAGRRRRAGRWRTSAPAASARWRRRRRATGSRSARCSRCSPTAAPTGWSARCGA